MSHSHAPNSQLPPLPFGALSEIARTITGRKKDGKHQKGVSAHAVRMGYLRGDEKYVKPVDEFSAAYLKSCNSSVAQIPKPSNPKTNGRTNGRSNG